MKPPGKTTLTRMQLAAQREAERIEISQDGRVRLGMQKEPLPEQVALRDDFAGIVRLIDLIQSDETIMERLAKARERSALATGPQKGAPRQAPDMELEEASEA